MASEISRRAFLKGVGSVAASAAATGILAGCCAEPTNPTKPTTPTTPAEPDLGNSGSSDNSGTSSSTATKKIYVTLVAKGTAEGGTYTMEVPKDATTIDVADIDPSWIPKQYRIVSTGSLPIEKLLGIAEYVSVSIRRIPIPQDITVRFVDYDTQLPLTVTATMTVTDEDTTVDISKVKIPEGYDAIGSVADINNNEITVKLTTQSQNVTVHYNLWAGGSILVETIKVPRDATFVTLDQLRESYKPDPDKVGFFYREPESRFPIKNGHIWLRVEKLY